MYTVFALNAAIGMNIPMYGTLKRFVPLVTLYFAMIVLKKGKPNRAVVGSIVMVTFGAILISITGIEEMLKYSIN